MNTKRRRIQSICLIIVLVISMMSTVGTREVKAGGGDTKPVKTETYEAKNSAPKLKFEYYLQSNGTYDMTVTVSELSNTYRYDLDNAYGYDLSIRDTKGNTTVNNGIYYDSDEFVIKNAAKNSKIKPGETFELFLGFMDQMDYEQFSSDKEHPYQEVCSTGAWIKFTAPAAGNSDVIDLGNIKITREFKEGMAIKDIKYTATTDAKFATGKKISLNVVGVWYEKNGKRLSETTVLSKNNKYEEQIYVGIKQDVNSPDYKWVDGATSVSINGQFVEEYYVANDGNDIRIPTKWAYSIAYEKFVENKIFEKQLLDLDNITVTRVSEIKSGVKLGSIEYKAICDAGVKLKCDAYWYDAENKNKLSKDAIFENGKTYTERLYVYIVTSNQEYHWIGHVKSVVYNGKAYENYEIVDDSNDVYLENQYTIQQLKQPMKVSVKTKTVKAKSVKKKKQIVKKAIVVSKAQGTVSYKKISKGSSSKLTIDQSGNITVKKGTKKGTYKIKVQVRAAGNEKYLEGSKTVTVKIKVK